ncbi:putative transcriptional regulatory protein C1F7.11c [Hypsizygus marmoreus]|uniref:Transcriptional regulatory protein C1F7.11c n=1 Tax=Hypsizygus marmoreus TaxID=39966 RepID=A0A369K038_HYPMA|nr:putative transcriptional regulatory protein C1F7.11c [Hypsizygus marmoreus]
MHRTVNGKEKDGVQKTRRKPGRVPTSCAECRRLKLRCDKNVPCEKCVSRGCGSICPDGSLTPGKGNRLVLANTEELHDRIEQLCTRIRELENALRSLQESVSQEPHPLLQNGILQPTPSQPFQPSPPMPISTSTTPPRSEERLANTESNINQAEEDSFIDAFGTLTLGHRGQCTFLGKSARSEYLLHAQALAMAQPQIRNIIPSRLTKQMTDSVFPEPEVADKALGREVFALLPPLSEAIRLCEVYQEHGKYMYTPVPPAELLDEILVNVYRTDSFDSLTCHHSLALLLIIFALAILFDPGRQPYSNEAEEFYQLSRTALGFSPQTTRLSIQALIHISEYLEFSDWDSMSSNSKWMYIGHAVKMGQSIGLHLNCARWNLSEANVQRRCRLFWQLFFLDSWGSFNFGRPPSMSFAFIDCPVPTEVDEPLNADGEKTTSFHSWNWQYSALLHSVMAAAFGPKMPAYSVILSLDRRIRDFPVPPPWRPVCERDEDQSRPVQVEVQMRRWFILASKEYTLLNLHRAYLAQALLEMPTELPKHRYIPSVIAIYRSAWRIIEALRQAWQLVPHPLSRFSSPWSQALSAAIVMCLLVTRAPTSHMASSALTELDLLLKVFQEASPKSRAAANMLDSISKLYQKAQNAMDQTLSHTVVPSSSVDDDLDRLGGKTSLLAETGASDSETCGPSAAPDLTANMTAIHSDYYFSEANTGYMHPTLAHDMRSFDTGGPTFNDFFDFPAAPVAQHQQPAPDPQTHGLNLYGGGNYQMYQQQPPPLVQFEQAAPILDSTWQSFVEQLGF